MIDIQGPQVVDPDGPLGPAQAIQVVTDGVANETFHLFGARPSAGPTPPVDALLINISDLPERFSPEFLARILDLEDVDRRVHYELTGDNVGSVVIVDITVLQEFESGSPAIDAGNPSMFPGLDQRGYDRPRDGDGDGVARPDIGAFELENAFSGGGSSGSGVTTIPGGGVGADASFAPAAILVTTQDDVVDPDDAVVSLREAIRIANDSPGADSIEFAHDVFDAGLSDTITLNGTQFDPILGELVIDGTIDADGAQITLNADARSRVFQIDADATVTLRDLILTEGHADDGDPDVMTVGDYGGAVLNDGTLFVEYSTINHSSAGLGGGIANQSGTVTITDTTLSENSALSGGAIANQSGSVTITDTTVSGNSAGFGGAISNQSGTVTITDATLSENSAEFGGAISNQSGSVTIVDATLSDNSAESGGAIANEHGNVTINDSTLSANSATGPGGAIWSEGAGAVVTVTDSLLSQNSAGTEGGGIWNQNGSALAVVRSTISQNSSANQGGGIRNGAATVEVTRSLLVGNTSNVGGGIANFRGHTTITNSTVSGNSTLSGGGGLFIGSDGRIDVYSSTITNNRSDIDNGFGSEFEDGGGIRNQFRTLNLYNTIVAGNFQGTGDAAVPDDISNNVTDGSYNLIGDAATAGGLVHGTNGNLVGVDPRLKPLADNGGPTLTHALERGIPTRLAIRLEFASPLPDDRYTLTIRDTLTDPAGNPLDGENNTHPASGRPVFPSGDGTPGGDFVAAFVVDSRPEIGTFGPAGVFVDANGNFESDAVVVAGENYDPGRDLTVLFGGPADVFFAGQFKPAGAAEVNGFDRIGAYGLTGGAYRFLLDLNGNGRVEAGETLVSDVQVNGSPVAGDFDGNPTNGDEIGLFIDGVWHLDTTGDNRLNEQITGDLSGLPVVGDFDGDGIADLATFRPTSNTFEFSLSSAGGGVANGNSNATHTYQFGFPTDLERPFAADFNLDGVHDFGLVVPDQTGQGGPLEWYVVQSEAVGSTLPFEPFWPAPAPGNDLFFTIGDNQSLPLVGNFATPPGPDQNTAPEFQIDHREVSHAEETMTIPLPVFDPDGDLIDYQATAAEVAVPLMVSAYELDQQLGLRSNGNYLLNWGGAGEKWMQSAGNVWHFIAPDGTLYRWTGARPGAGFLSGSTVVASLSPEYHATPHLLHDAALPIAAPPAGIQVEVQDGELIITNAGGQYIGEVAVIVTGTDGLVETTEQFAIRYTNSLPELLPTLQTIGRHGGALIDLPVIDSDGDVLSYDVELLAADPLAELAYQLDQQLGLTFTGSYVHNWGGAGEKWMQSASGTWHFITPDGTLYRWTGARSGAGFLSGSVVVAHLDGTYHADPGRLHDAPEPQGGDSGGSTAAEVGGQLVVTPGDGFLGELKVRVTVADGLETASTTFTVTVANLHPDLALADQTVSHAAGSLQIDLPASDGDGDLVTYTAELLAGDPLAELGWQLDQQLGLRHAGTYVLNWGGAGEKWMQSASGAWYFITPDGTLYRWTGARSGAGFLSGSVVVATLDGAFHADPARLHDAPEPQGGDVGGSTAEIVNGNQLLVTFGDGFTGDLRVVVGWSDGIDTGEAPLTVTVTNSLPELGLTDHEVPAGSGPLVIELPVIDDDADALDYSATILVHEPLAALAFELDEQLGLRFTGSYLQNWGGADERWLQSADSTWYFITPDGGLYRWTGSRPGANFLSGSVLVATLDGSYYAEPERLFNAQPPVAGDLRGSGVEIIGGDLIVTIGADFVGELRVTVTVWDGIDEQDESFVVRVLPVEEQQALDSAFAAWDGPVV